MAYIKRKEVEIVFKKNQFVKLWKNKNILIPLFFMGAIAKGFGASFAIFGFITNSTISCLGMSFLFGLSTVIDMALGERMASLLE